MTTKDYIATYKGIGIETNVDFEAQYAGQNFDDIRALAAQTGLEALMLGEEALILGGNTSMALGVTATPTLAASTSGGSLSAGTLSVICVALTLDGLINSSLASGIQASITRANADFSSDTFGGGAAQKSAAAAVAVTGSTGSVTASVAVKRGAFGYAWFWGTAGAEALGAITTINSAGHHRRRHGNPDRGVSAGRRLVVQRAGVRRPAHPGVPAGLRRQCHDPADRRRRRRHAAHRRWRGGHRRDRSGFESQLGPVSAFA